MQEDSAPPMQVLPLTHDSRRGNPHNFCNHCGDLCSFGNYCEWCGSNEVVYCCDKQICWAGCA